MSFMLMDQRMRKPFSHALTALDMELQATYPLAADRRRLRSSITETGRHRSIMYFGVMPCRHL